MTRDMPSPGSSAPEMDEDRGKDLRSRPKRRVGIIINTPAQVHFYRYIYQRLRERGHQAFIIARAERETLDLLREFALPHSTYCDPSRSQIGKILSLPRDVAASTALLKRHQVDIVTGFGVYDAFSSALLGVPSVVFIDNEPKIGMRSYQIQFHLFYPFVKCLLTPSYFKEDLGKRHTKVDAMKEMAYLHPCDFKPDASVYEALGIERGDRYSLLRFNGMGAFHDLGVGGFSDEDKVRLVQELEKYGHVFISSEKRLPPGLEGRAIKLPKRCIHDAEFFASLLVTDTQTMATEAAILGTPTVRCNSFVGDGDMGNFIQLEKQYRLLFSYRDPGEAIAAAIELMKDVGAKAEWGRRREELLKNMIDLAAFMVWYIENHPRSVEELRRDPRLQDRFRCRAF
jgi:predicted glycosyltransferase